MVYSTGRDDFVRFSAGIEAVVLSNNLAHELNAATASQVMQRHWDSCQKQDSQRQADRQTGMTSF